MKTNATNEDGLATLFVKLRTRLLAKGLTDADFALLEATNIDKLKYAQYCRMAISFFAEIGRLPPRESAALLRSIHASK
jgi:hypothetical protein